MTFNWPTYSKEEIKAVTSILKSGKVNYWNGNEIKQFEKEFAILAQSKFAIALANGTVALEVALKSIGVSTNDEVIVTSRTYIASVSSIVNLGASPIFADVDLDTQNITSEKIKNLITKKTKAIVCVHLAGWPCDMDPIIKIAKKNNLFVIEDCAQAHGASYKGRSVGSIGDIGCWSFCNDKIISTGGEGGMVTTNNKEFFNFIWSYKDHGKNINLAFKKNEDGRFKWLHNNFGSNYRMTEMQAAIGRIQLKKIFVWNKIRRNYANAIWNVAKKIPNLRVGNLKCEGCSGNCSDNKKCVHAAYKCYVFVKGSSKLRDAILQEINLNNIPCFTGSCSEVYLEEAFKNKFYKPEKRLKNAKQLGETSLMFLCHQNIKKNEIDRTCEILKKVALSKL